LIKGCVFVYKRALDVLKLCIEKMRYAQNKNGVIALDGILFSVLNAVRVLCDGLSYKILSIAEIKQNIQSLITVSDQQICTALKVLDERDYLHIKYFGQTELCLSLTKKALSVCFDMENGKDNRRKSNKKHYLLCLCCGVLGGFTVALIIALLCCFTGGFSC
jgi:hypothetical protein